MSQLQLVCGNKQRSTEVKMVFRTTKARLLQQGLTGMCQAMLQVHHMHCYFQGQAYLSGGVNEEWIRGGRQGCGGTPVGGDFRERSQVKKGGGEVLVVDSNKAHGL